MINNKCNNCGFPVTQKTVNEKQGYRLSDKYSVCGNCYKMYSKKIKEFIKANPNMDDKTIAKMNNLPLSLINMIKEEGIYNEIHQELKQNEIQKQEEQKQNDALKVRIKAINALREAMDANNNSNTNTQQDVKVRTLTPNNYRRF